jgi:hypothetical protein
MGDIYAAAYLTIIAAAGTSPCYGLPGVQPTPRKPPDHVPVGSVRVYALPEIKGHQDAFATSKWVSRAWTFQEGFFSRRRLIFTERQMMFVCNTSTRYEALTLPLLDRGGESTSAHVTPRDQDRTESGLDNSCMGRARRYIESYSGRALQFDGDALDAIKGALNTLAGERIHRISGVPFHVSGPEEPALLNGRKQDLRGEIYLSWRSFHNKDGFYVYRPRGYPRRRMEFPSWSPMGWDCSINFHKPVEAAGISVQMGNGEKHLKENMSGIVATNSFQQLRLELPAATFSTEIAPTYALTSIGTFLSTNSKTQNLSKAYCSGYHHKLTPDTFLDLPMHCSYNRTAITTREWESLTCCCDTERSVQVQRANLRRNQSREQSTCMGKMPAYSKATVVWSRQTGG